jgi:hypothetical protein
MMKVSNSAIVVLIALSSSIFREIPYLPPCHGLVSPHGASRRQNDIRATTTALHVATAETPSKNTEDFAATSFTSEIAASAAMNKNAGQKTEDEELDSVDFPPPLSTLDRMKRAATFWSTAIPIVANYYGLIGNIKLQELLGNDFKEEDIEVGICVLCCLFIDLFYLDFGGSILVDPVALNICIFEIDAVGCPT